MALIPKFFLDCVVAIGVSTKRETDQEQIRWIASGFLYGEYWKTENEQRIYKIYLVTNRHVFEEIKQVVLRFNPTGKQPAKQYSLNLVDISSKRKLWTPHPNASIDIAITTINISLLKEHGIQFAWFRNDQHVATLDKIAELGITEGDYIYTLGFPMGLIGPERNYVIVRSGNIARIQDAIDQRSNEFLIDAFTFPGNSGGPVVTKPELVGITRTKVVKSRASCKIPLNLCGIGEKVSCHRLFLRPYPQNRSNIRQKLICDRTAVSSRAYLPFGALFRAPEDTPVPDQVRGWVTSRMS